MKNLWYLYSAVMWRTDEKENPAHSLYVYEILWQKCACNELSREWLERSWAEMLVTAKEEGNCGVKCGCMGTFTRAVCQD